MFLQIYFTFYVLFCTCHFDFPEMFDDDILYICISCNDVMAQDKGTQVADPWGQIQGYLCKVFKC